VFASDGFVKVTGYSRTDIIPRNCRFLQGNHTDHSAVRRLRASIGASKESVELLLNYRKTGEPFWNLLYVSKCVLGALALHELQW
jgi:phototropin